MLAAASPTGGGHASVALGLASHSLGAHAATSTTLVALQRSS